MNDITTERMTGSQFRASLASWRRELSRASLQRFFKLYEWIYESFRTFFSAQCEPDESDWCGDGLIYCVRLARLCRPDSEVERHIPKKVETIRGPQRQFWARDIFGLCVLSSSKRSTQQSSHRGTHKLYQFTHNFRYLDVLALRMKLVCDFSENNNEIFNSSVLCVF